MRVSSSVPHATLTHLTSAFLFIPPPDLQPMDAPDLQSGGGVVGAL